MDRELNLPLERQLVSILAANREDAYGTQHKRTCTLFDAARRIVEKFGLQKWENLGQKHVLYVIESWKAEDSDRRSIANNLSHLRWLVRKIGKANLMPKSNRDLGIEPGPRHTRAGKVIDKPTLAANRSRIDDDRIQAMVGLGRYLGMRMREASLFRPHRDCDGNRILLNRGTKGGRPRYLFLRTPEQHEALNAARALVSGDEALIPREFATFEQWRQYVYRQLRAAGFSREKDQVFHDLRRSYAVERMDQLIRERRWDRHSASKLVSKELGHNRIEILDWYIDWEADAATAA